MYAVAHFTVAVLLAAYSAFLISYLTLRRPVLPFNSFSELLNDSTYQLGVHAASYIWTFDMVSIYNIRRFGEVNHTVTWANVLILGYENGGESREQGR